MTLRRPPQIASWLLLHLGCSTDNEAVLGDLAERYQEGLPPAWYWKQTFVAIVVGAFEDLQASKFLAFRAVLAGCLIQSSIEFFVARYFPLVPYWVPLSWWGTGFESIVTAMMALLLGIVVGWMIARLSQGRKAILLCYLLIVQMLGALTIAISETGLAVYLSSIFSLSIGILTGGLGLYRPARIADIPEGDTP